MAKLYSDLAGDWYRLLSPLEHYEKEADQYHGYFIDSGAAIATMLELGSGAGHNAYYLRQWYTMTLTDLSEQMLAISRRINPECEHIQGDMRTLRLGKTFDAVFIHDAIMYMTTLDDLRAAIETAFVHLRPGGVVLIIPDFVRETFKENTESGGTDGDGRSLRYLEWMTDPDPTDTQITVDYAYALKDADGSVAVEHERMIEGLFGKQQWIDAMRSVGLTPTVLPDDQYHRVNFLCVKPA